MTGRFKRGLAELTRLSPNIPVFIVYGLLYDAAVNVYKPFSMKFLTRLGGDETFISLMNSLPGIIAAAVILPGAIFLNRFRNIKRVTRVLFLTSRSVLLAIAFIPFFPAAARPYLYVALISLMNLPDSLSQTAVQASLGTFFKNGGVRAAAISLRNKFGNIFIPVVTILTGLIFAIFPKNDAQTINFYQTLFVAAFIIGLFEIKTFGKFKIEAEESERPVKKASFGTVLKVFNDKKFTGYMASTLIFYFCWHSGWTLSGIYHINNLGANEIWLAVFAVASGVSSFFSAGFWNKQIAKRGNEKTLIAAALAVAGNMFMMGLSPNLVSMIPAMVFTGFSSIGVNIVLLNGLIANTPDEDRMVYVGVYNTCTSVSLGVAPLAALMLLNRVGVVYTMFAVGAARTVSAGAMYLMNKKLKTGYNDHN